LITRGEPAIFNLEIKKKRRSIFDLDIHHSKDFSSGKITDRMIESEGDVFSPN